MKALIVVLTLLPLAGCISDEELAQRDQNVCAGYGFEAGTPSMANCLMQQDRDRRARISAMVNSMPRPATCTTIGYMTTCN